MSAVKILHNPKCGTSRKVLGMIEAAGIQPEIILYLQNPPSEAELRKIIKDLNMPVRAMMRYKAPEYEALKNEQLTDDELIEAMMEHPILIERPIVITDKGTRLCRPAEVVQELLS